MADKKQKTRIFKNKWFTRFAKREKFSDTVLKKVIDEAERGIVDADLGGSIIKQRVARPGQGKSGGYRTIIVFTQPSPRSQIKVQGTRERAMHWCI